MKRSISPEFTSQAKRLDGYHQPPPQYQHQSQQMHIQQQQQMLNQQHLQAAAVQQQQHQQQFQMQQQIQAVQQPQSYASTQPFFQQPQYFPVNSVNMNPFPPTPPPMMYNTSLSWNFMSTPPPTYYTPPQTAGGASPQPPLPPPEKQSEKPPLPKDPEPAGGYLKTDFTIRTNVPPPTYNGSGPNVGTLRASGSQGGIRIRGYNSLNGVMYKGFNTMRPPPVRQPSLPLNGSSKIGLPYSRNRRRNPHHFPTGNANSFFPRMNLSHYGELEDEDQPAAPEKLTIILKDTENGQIQVNKKAKRKPMSTRYARAKQWVLEDAQAALALEKEYSQQTKRQMLILKFPDPDLNKHIVKKYSPCIESVHFQQPSTPRYCFVQLKEGSDTVKVLETIRQIPFGTGKIVAEVKNQHADDQTVSPEEIDPYTLYIGNLPTSISVRVVKTHFPNALRIDIGYAQRMRYTRYAFIRYNTVAEAMEAYKNTVNALLESRSLIVRFRRQKGNIGLPGEAKINAPPREGREILPKTKAKPWDDSDDLVDDFHDDEEGFLLDDLEEDDDNIEHEGHERVPLGLLDPKVEHDLSSKSVELSENLPESLQKLKAANAEIKKKQKAQLPNDPDKSQETTRNVQASQPPVEQSQNKLHRPIGMPPILENTKILLQPKPANTHENIDTKDNVLEKAKQLMETTPAAVDVAPRPRSESPDVICTDPPETARKVRLEVKTENNAEDKDSDDEGGNLLGTRVKDESQECPGRGPTPTLDDIYLDDYEYDDMDAEPEEENDDWADTSSASRPTADWEEFRRQELNTKEDKPDLDKLVKPSDTQPSSLKVLPIVANLELKVEMDRLFASQSHSLNVTLGDTDDLHDMFAQMNSDISEDDDEQF